MVLLSLQFSKRSAAKYVNSLNGSKSSYPSNNQGGSYRLQLGNNFQIVNEYLCHGRGGSE